MNVYEQAKEDYKKAFELNLTNIDRWDKNLTIRSDIGWWSIPLSEHDFKDYNDYFCWKVGGDGDNGETLMYQMDAFFEMLDKIGDNSTQQQL